MKTKIDWTDKEAVRAYKAGYMRGQRLYKYLPPADATALARQVMMNEIDRKRRVLAPMLHKKRARAARIEGTNEWRQLA